MKDIPGYEGLYAVTSCGKVWSYRKKMFLKPYKVGKGYLKVDLRKGEGRDQRSIHRLVAEAYIPNPDGLETVNHIDENKENNSVLNLEWMSRADNIRYGTRSQRSAESRKKPIYCVELDTTFASVSEAAEQLNLNAGNVSNVLKGRYKTTGGYHFKYVN